MDDLTLYISTLPSDKFLGDMGHFSYLFFLLQMTSFMYTEVLGSSVSRVNMHTYMYMLTYRTTAVAASIAYKEFANCSFKTS